MKQVQFRDVMDYLHTWVGVIISALLFLVFFMGSLAVFDREIDRWMMPATRINQPAAVSFDRDALPHLKQLAPNAAQWLVLYPSAREPAMAIAWRDGKDKDRKVRHVDVATGTLLPDVGTLGATQFFYPFHYSFHLKWFDIGYWLLAIVSIGMLVMIISGVIIHKKIFTDFFTFRPDKSSQRITLDVHNICGVLILPFHFLITLSGLIIFIFIYFKPAVPLLYGKDTPKATQEAFGQIVRPPLKIPGQLAAVDPMVTEAQLHWGNGAVRNVSIANPADKNAVVQVQRRTDDQVGTENMAVYFDGQNANVLRQQQVVPIAKIQRFFTGMHMIPFSHWGLRWLYFLMGLSGCVLIGSGLLLWVDKRQVRHAKQGQRGYRFVNGLACASTLGVVIATLSMLLANRALPLSLPNRASLEVSIYFAIWVSTFAHAAWRAGLPFTRKAWRDQAWAIAALAFLAVVFNALTTRDWLFVAMLNNHWAVGCVDLVLLVTASIATYCALRFRTTSKHTCASTHTQSSTIQHELGA